MSEDFKKRDRDRKRVKYWFTKCVAVGLIPHTLDTEDKLRAMFREWQESQGRPIIIDGEKGENEPHESTEGTTVDEFYQTKKNWQKTQDQKWDNELRKDENILSPDRQTEKMDRIRWGESL